MKRSIGKTILLITLTVLCLGAVGVMAWLGLQSRPEATEPTVTTVPTEPTTEPTTVPTEPPHNWQPGFVATLGLKTEYTDETGAALGTLTRGQPVEYEMTEDGRTSILVNDRICYLQEGTYVVTDTADTVPEHTRYVRSAVNLRTREGRLLETFAP